MVILTRLSGSVFALNSDLIERVDATPDTVITLVDGKKYIVREDLQDVVAVVRAYRSSIVADSAHVAAGNQADTREQAPAEARHLTAVPLPLPLQPGHDDSKDA